MSPVSFHIRSNSNTSAPVNNALLGTYDSDDPAANCHNRKHESKPEDRFAAVGFCCHL
jgi:hypothetical protein